MVNYYILYDELWLTLINYYKLIDYGQLLIKYDYYEQPLTSMNHHEPPLTINLINSYTRKTFPWRFFSRQVWVPIWPEATQVRRWVTK